MSERVLGLVGLGMRSGRVVVGVEAVRAGLQRGDLKCIVMAADASPRAVEKVTRLARARAVACVPVAEAGALGARLGRPPVMVVGVRDAKLAAGLVAAGQPVKQ